MEMEPHQMQGETRDTASIDVGTIADAAEPYVDMTRGVQQGVDLAENAGEAVEQELGESLADRMWEQTQERSMDRGRDEGLSL